MKIIAHRGASGYAPENTFASFELAVTLRADIAETDIRLTRDGVMVLHHDDKLDRTTDGVGPLADLTYEELQKLDAGSKFSPQFASQRIPRLDETLERFLHRIPFCLEVKVAGAIAPLVALLRERNLFHSDRVEFTSFDWEIVTGLHAVMPHMRIALLAREFNEQTIAQVAGLGLRQICTSFRNITPELVKLCHSRGLLVRGWGIKTREDLAAAESNGADQAACNYPDWYERNKVLK